MKNEANDASTTPRTATSAYAAARNDIARLLHVLDMELAKHILLAKADEKNRGFAGNLQKFRCDLVDAVALIADMDRSGVEALLDDMRGETLAIKNLTDAIDAAAAPRQEAQ